MDYTYEELANMNLTYGETKGTDAEREDCTSSGLQCTVFQVILPSPVLRDDCEKLIRLPSRTAMQDIYKKHEDQKCRSENWLDSQ
ncbi:hypothetical protein TNCT_170691 [Trichonephila clavata]|uniref:Uncharacterized protein n=1 Tax=Trichonephila clavata TaxID=2740835 RepID=A0A8X6JQV4_TRICU|nr:hypothetical protein TNCT_170691 [Trichonephila clavata]